MWIHLCCILLITGPDEIQGERSTRDMNARWYSSVGTNLETSPCSADHRLGPLNADFVIMHVGK
jgi:hypothetical protein